ncbi:spore germination protein [Paenibacillus filicis]|uniref:Spore germination protein n=1 Tax=Paenibacillus filicis TaxID=669464 RepID=A0ABU9DHZ7_9BACL
MLEERMQYTEDLIIVEPSSGVQPGVLVCYLDGLVDPMKLENLQLSVDGQGENRTSLYKQVPVPTVEEAVHRLAQGYTVIINSPAGTGTAIETLGVQLRSVEEPSSEVTVKGPRSGFTESMQNNLALIRFHFPSPELKVECRNVGKLSQTQIAVLSVGGLTNTEIVREVHRRIEEIPLDSILSSNYLEEWITDNKYTLFPLIETTERPDRVAGALLDGRVAVLVQGCPFVLLLPFVFLQAFQVSEDYNWNFYIGSVIRLLRLFSGLIGLFLPAFYVATITYHHELVPTPLLQSIAAAKEPVPFPAVVESFAMMIAFEIMREAGVRMPKQVGQAVSIVGALILGQAAVQAGIVSPIMVIVAALTGICTFTLSPTAVNYVIRMLQFGMTVFAALLGYVGIMVAAILLLTYLASLRSFGVPYLGPVAPFDLSGLTDVLVRRPLVVHDKLPRLFKPLRTYRFRSKR